MDLATLLVEWFLLYLSVPRQDWTHRTDTVGGAQDIIIIAGRHVIWSQLAPIHLQFDVVFLHGVSAIVVIKVPVDWGLQRLG